MKQVYAAERIPRNPPMYTNEAIVGAPTALKTAAVAVSVPSPVVGYTERIKKLVTAYTVVQNPIPPMTAFGTSFFGSTDSSAIAVIPSNPKNEKKTTELAVINPENPSLKKGLKFEGLQ